MSEPDILVRQIIRNYMGLSDSRIWLKNENINAPKDNSLFIVVGAGPSTVVSVGNYFDHVTGEEQQRILLYTTIDIDVVSRNRDANERKEEVLMAFQSTAGVQVLEENSARVSRVRGITDLSEIEGSSSLHRFRVSVIINHIKTKTVVSPPSIDKFQRPEVLVNE